MLWSTFERSILRAPVSEELVYRLGLCLPLDEAAARRCLEETGFPPPVAPLASPGQV